MKLTILPGMDFVTLIVADTRIGVVELVKPRDLIWTLMQYRRALDFDPTPRTALDEDEILACAGAV